MIPNTLTVLAVLALILSVLVFMRQVPESVVIFVIALLLFVAYAVPRMMGQ